MPLAEHPTESATRSAALGVGLRLRKGKPRIAGMTEPVYWLATLNEGFLVHGGQWGDHLDGCADVVRERQLDH